MDARDRIELTDLVTRLGRWLDDKTFDDAASVFTEDAEAHTPGGVARGRDALVRQASRNHTVPTQHFITDHRFEPDGDGVRVTANLLVVFVREDGPHLLGERYDLRAARTADGWRITRVQGDPIWEAAHA
ncbi:nuclear transport factor 2 family protein [Spirillospora sp. NPDC052242]